MIEYLGSYNNLALFTNGELSAIVDVNLNMVTEFGVLSTLQPREWSKEVAVTDATIELAAAALITIEKSLTASAGRMYTIPDGVKAEAEKALKWRKEHKRGGTPVGLNTARTLARGGQIGLAKVRHIAKYFPRHEVDKKGKGWEPGEDNFPSNGRIAWALWGGDSAWRWAQAIVERENKKGVTATGYNIPGYEDHLDSVEYEDSYDSELNAFKMANDLDASYGPEFIARVRLDGSGIDRLYKIEIDGRVYVWDDCSWDDLGHVEGDIYTYDSSLDDAYDTVEKTHILIDPSSAVVMSAMLQENPYKYIQLEDLDSEEAEMMADAIPNLDFEMLDRVLTAAGEGFGPAKAKKSATSPTAHDGVYTPEERSAKAVNQPRDGSGRFAKAGSDVQVGQGPKAQRGTITKVDSKTGNVAVKLQDGRTINVPAKYTKAYEAGSEPLAPMGERSADNFEKPLDTSGILGEPRTPVNMPKAHLPGTLPPLDADGVRQMLNDWNGYVQKQRGQYRPVDNYDKGLVQSRYGVNKFAGENSILAAGEEKPLTPETSDVAPKYIAIVSPNDPAAVMDFVALVPKTATSTAPMTYKREKGQWVPDEQILKDLQSATPPPVVVLDTKELVNEILLQVDKLKNVGSTEAPAEKEQATPATQETPAAPAATAASAFLYEHLINFWGDSYQALVAAGGLDRNRGNAEKLRHYWTRGKGALKIRWGQPGDWKRCVKHLAKYLGVRAKGYCQLRHKEATGMYTATHAKLDREKKHRLRNVASNEEMSMEEVWTKNIGTPNYIEDKDLLMPIDDIVNEHDDLYDASWMPEPEIEELLNDESCVRAMTAAGGFDRNRGKAEELRHYWTRGVGGAKIMWGVPGDWTRCVRHLSKYMGPRAKGYCQLRHKEMTGVYTGSRFNVGKNSKNAFSSLFSSEDELVEKTIEKSALYASINALKEKMGLVAGANMMHGARFTIPLVIPEELESGDGRAFKKNSISFRDLPLPLMWQIKTNDGHMGSVVVGRIDYMERTPEGIGNAYGVFDSGPYGREAQRLVENGFLRGVSADLDQFEAKEQKSENSGKEDIEDDEISKKKLIINHARIMAATIVAKPAFQECTISIDENYPQQEEQMVPEDGIYEESIDSFVSAEALTASGFLEAPIPVTPPREWFNNPGLTKPTPITVDPSGRIFGHIAAWHVNHIGMPRSTKPPRSRSKYAYFHTGVVRTDDGSDIPVGQLTLAGGHAPLNADAVSAAKHYDDTASAIADVHAGEDDYGIWVAGSLRPDANELQIRALRASAPSGDWRPINGSLELVAVCQVNVPGFPIARAMIASGKVMALVAAGASYFAIMKSTSVSALIDRASRLNELTTTSNDLMTRFETQFGYVSKDKREELAKAGKAMPDGSFPIRNVADLKNAIQAHGRAKDIAAAKKHIIKRARALGKYDLIPDEWKKPKTIQASALVDSLKERTLLASAISEFSQIGEEERKTLAKKGHALPDGSYPIRNESDLKAAIHSYGRSKEEDRAKVKKHIIKRAKQLDLKNLIPSNWNYADAVTAAANLEKMRAVIASLSITADATAPEDGKQPSAADIQKLIDAKAEADKQTEEEVKRAEDIKAGKDVTEPGDEVGYGEVPTYDPEEGRIKYTPKTQPRDARGKYRQVLARLKQDLGVSGLQDALQKAQEAEDMDFAGNYTQSAAASAELLGMLDRLDQKALNPKSLENVRNTANIVTGKQIGRAHG